MFFRRWAIANGAVLDLAFARRPFKIPLENPPWDFERVDEAVGCADDAESSGESRFKRVALGLRGCLEHMLGRPLRA